MVATNNRNKISVVGAGAIGTMIGGLIKHHRSGGDLVLIARGPHGERMRQSAAAVLRGPWGSLTVPVTATTDYEQIAGSDLVLLTVKSQATVDTAEQIAPHLGDAVVVSLQNGINQRNLLKFVRPDRLLVGMTATNMELTEPGVVSLQRNGVSVIGSPTGDVPDSLVDQARRTLALSGLKFESSRNILGVQYNKLLMNTVGYASVLSASNFVTDGILYRPWRKNVALPLLDEGLSVLAEAGIKLERTSGISDVLRFQRLLRVLNAPGFDWVIRGALRHLLRPKKIVYSVYQDLIRGKPTEIDYVNGEIVRLAESCQIPSPYNRRVVQMIRELEDQPRFPSHDQVIAAFRDIRHEQGRRASSAT
jgi:2-dehydropantoate 2-reductase